MTYDFFPFTSQSVVWSSGNKVFLDEEEVYHGYVCLEKLMISEEIRSIKGASGLKFDNHCKVEFILPKLMNPALLPIIKASYKQRMDGARRLSGGDPDVWNNSRAEIEDKYMKDLEDAGYSHLTYGFTYPGYPPQESVIDAIKNLEKQILEF